MICNIYINIINFNKKRYIFSRTGLFLSFFKYVGNKRTVVKLGPRCDEPLSITLKNLKCSFLCLSEFPVQL
jgi:hypothetical protein